MTEVVTTTHDRPKPKRQAMARRVLYWSAQPLAVHLGCARSYIEQLVEQGVIERRADGAFDQDQCRSKYIAHLRAEHRRSPRAAADAEFALAKAELVRIRIAEKKRQLIPLEEAFGQMDEVVGLILTGLSGLRPGAAVMIWPRAAGSTKPCTICASRYPKPHQAGGSARRAAMDDDHDDRSDDRR